MPQPPQMPQTSQATLPPVLPVTTIVSEEDKTMGMLIHLLALLTGFIGVLILWLMKKDQSRFVDHHGRESLNFMLSLLLYSICMMALLMVVGILTLGIGFFIFFPVYFLLIIGSIVLEILACMAANRGEWHRYPITIRFISN